MFKRFLALGLAISMVVELAPASPLSTTTGSSVTQNIFQQQALAHFFIASHRNILHTLRSWVSLGSPNAIQFSPLHKSVSPFEGRQRNVQRRPILAKLQMVYRRALHPIAFALVVGINAVAVVGILSQFAAQMKGQNQTFVAQAWNEEFSGPANSRPDPAKWTYDLGAGGWGNNEQETYTDSIENAHLDGQGHLVIRVVRNNGEYTSARLKTQGLFASQYGRLEARIKVPSGRGIWPAWWMLGNTYDGSNWPNSGELDIMEIKGVEPGTNYGTLHGPGYSGGRGISQRYHLPNDQTFSDDFHVFAIQWAPQKVTWFVDGNAYHTVTADSIPSGAKWVFDQPFFILLNVAVGGNFGGPLDPSVQFPKEMIVDYIHYTPESNSPAAPNPAEVKLAPTETILGPFISGGNRETGDHYSYKNGQFRLANTKLVIHVRGAEGTKGMVQLLPNESSFGSEVGLSNIVTVKNGDIELNASDCNLTPEQLNSIEQISLKSDKQAYRKYNFGNANGIADITSIDVYRLGQGMLFNVRPEYAQDFLNMLIGWHMKSLTIMKMGTTPVSLLYPTIALAIFRNWSKGMFLPIIGGIMLFISLILESNAKLNRRQMPFIAALLFVYGAFITSVSTMYQFLNYKPAEKNLIENKIKKNSQLKWRVFDLAA